MANKLSHVSDGNPEMVDVGHKSVTRRIALALAVVSFPEEVFDELEREGFASAKGPILQTANLAGVMGAKKTSDLIPLCHPLALSKVGVHYEIARPEIHIFCEAKLDGKTGVEMEALTGASIAALTVYDMCKALSHDIVIKEVRLISKTGGKSDFKHHAPEAS